MKPHYIFFYKNDNAIDDLLKQNGVLRRSLIIKENRSKEQCRIEFEHFTLRCFKMIKPHKAYKGTRSYQILVEDELYDMMDYEYLSCVLIPMMCPYEMFGGRVVRITNFENLKGEKNES